MKKKVLIALAVLVLVPVISLGLGLFLTMRGLAPMPADGQDLVGDARAVSDGFTVSYLLPFTGGVALVDCGNDEKGAAILAELKKRSLGPDDVKAIFLTHGHADHTAACHLFTKAEIYAFPGDVEIAAGNARSRGPLPRWVGMPAEKKTKVTKTLTDGEIVTLGDREVVAFAVPGHTSGSAAFFSKGVLLLGDDAQAETGGALRPAMWLFTDDGDQNRRSLHELAGKIRQRGDKVEIIACGHSGPLTGAGALAAL
jgi:glyoxylase-like metal-dependent hydrolase (beta-lactamase superfamily II)